MKILLLIIFISLVNIGFSQKTKTEYIFKTSIVSIGYTIKYDSENLPTDSSFFVFAKDYRYQYLTELYTMKYGKIQDIYSFFKFCKLFLETEDAGVSQTHYGNYISISKTLGIKGVSIYGIGNDDDAYCVLGISHLNKYLYKLESWASTNKIALK